MNIYISGISGTGMGPLALMAKAAGHSVYGSDLAAGAIYDELKDAGIEVSIGAQDGKFLKSKIDRTDWLVYTSALPEDHAELVMAKEAGIKCTKRDDLTAFLVDDLGLKMVAVAGTHGKTTTTAMIIWACNQLNISAAYLVGSTLGFAKSGSYKKGDKYFIYEADEYDRNFLKYHPWLSVIPFQSYDHPDIYPTQEDYNNAFSQFRNQSEKVIDSNSDLSFKAENFKLAGEARRKDAALAAQAILEMTYQDAFDARMQIDLNYAAIIEVLNRFPGVGRRFEKLTDGIYSDYAHHPEEIAATIEVAQDEARLTNKKGVVVVYEPHQNVRQHEVRDGYKNAFKNADKIYWLPTYLTREDPNLKVLTNDELCKDIDGAEPVEMDDALWKKILQDKNDEYIVVLMTAGPADAWLRSKI